MAARHGAGKEVVARAWREACLRPWRTDIFKVSADPDFESKLADVVGLYLDAPEPPRQPVGGSLRRPRVVAAAAAQLPEHRRTVTAQTPRHLHSPCARGAHLLDPDALLEADSLCHAGHLHR